MAIMFKVNNLQCKVASSLEGSIGLDLQPADFITLVSCLTTGSLAHDDGRDDDNGGKSDDNSDEVMAVICQWQWIAVAKIGIVKIMMEMVKVLMTVMTNCNNTNNIADSNDDNGDNGKL